MIVPMLVNAIIELENANAMSIEMEKTVPSFSVVDKSIVQNAINSNASNARMVIVWTRKGMNVCHVLDSILDAIDATLMSV